MRKKCVGVEYAITLSTNVSGFYTICQTKYQSLTIQMVHKPLIYLSNFLVIYTLKNTPYTLYIFFPPDCKETF